MSVQYIISPPKRKESFVHFHKFYLALLYTIRYTGYIGLIAKAAWQQSNPYVSSIQDARSKNCMASFYKKLLYLKERAYQ